MPYVPAQVAWPKPAELSEDVEEKRVGPASYCLYRVSPLYGNVKGVCALDLKQLDVDWLVINGAHPVNVRDFDCCREVMEESGTHHCNSLRLTRALDGVQRSVTSVSSRFTTARGLEALVRDAVVQADPGRRGVAIFLGGHADVTGEILCLGGTRLQPCALRAALQSGMSVRRQSYPRSKGNETNRCGESRLLVALGLCRGTTSWISACTEAAVDVVLSAPLWGLSDRVLMEKVPPSRRPQFDTIFAFQRPLVADGVVAQRVHPPSEIWTHMCAVADQEQKDSVSRNICSVNEARGAHLRHSSPSSTSGAGKGGEAAARVNG